MALTKLAPVYDHFLDYLVKKATPEEILAFTLPESDLQRAEDLTERNKSGQLTAEEAAELEQILELDLLLSALKAKAMMV